MTFLIIALSVILIGIGFIGCFVHKIPGPAIAFAGMLLFIFGTDVPVPWTGIIICVVLLIALWAATKYFIPTITTKISEFGKGGKWGATIGSILGLLVILSFNYHFDLGPVGIVFTYILAFFILPFGLALLFETNSRKSLEAALKPATAAYLTYLLGLMLKLAICVYCIYVIITNGQG